MPIIETGIRCKTSGVHRFNKELCKRLADRTWTEVNRNLYAKHGADNDEQKKYGRTLVFC